MVTHGFAAGSASETDPLFACSFRLSVSDILAYERRSRELVGREKFFLFAVPFLAGGVAGMAPEEWAAPARWAVAGVAALSLGGLLLLARDLRRRRRARRRATLEAEVSVEDWGDHLVVASGSGRRFLALETIAQVIADREHLFLRHEGGPTILPLRVFADVADMQAYAAALDRRSREAGA